MPGRANSANPAATTAGPIVSGPRAPKRWMSPPDQRDSPPMIRVKGRNAAPASVAE